MQRRKDRKGRVLRDGEYQRSDGKYEYRYTDATGRHSVYSWQLVETDPLPPGKKRTVPLREQIKEINKKIDISQGVPGIRRNITFEEAFREWMASRTDLKRRTAERIESSYQSRIQKDFGQKRLGEITVDQIVIFFHKYYINKGYTSLYVQAMIRIMRETFVFAYRKGYIAINPFDQIGESLKQTPKAPKRKHALTVEQQVCLLNYMTQKNVNDLAVKMMRVLIRTGMRIGELGALRDTDIDFNNHIINVSRSVNRSDKTQEYYFTTPKTESSIRQVYMIPEVEQILKEIIKSSKPEAAAEQFGGLVFLSRRGKPCDSKWLTPKIKAAVDKYNKEEVKKATDERRPPRTMPTVTAHTARHIFATRNYESGIDIKLLQTILGHASVVTTMDIYTDSDASRMSKWMGENHDKILPQSLPQSLPQTSGKI